MEELSVYAFSVENFKRPSEEVTLLMKLFKDMSKKLIELKTARKPNFTQSINVRFIGNTELLDEEIQTLFRKVESLNSLHNT